jgi:hypothetical protein
MLLFNGRKANLLNMIEEASDYICGVDLKPKK